MHEKKGTEILPQDKMLQSQKVNRSKNLETPKMNAKICSKYENTQTPPNKCKREMWQIDSTTEVHHGTVMLIN